MPIFISTHTTKYIPSHHLRHQFRSAKIPLVEEIKEAQMRMIAEAGGGTVGAANNRCFPASLGLVAKPCDCCNSAAALLFCLTDSAYMCMTCDAKIHDTNKIGSTHERVWMCEVCEQAPASVACKADAASLCDSCDRDIHSVNHLARRHERLPVVPFCYTAESVVKSTATTFAVPPPVISISGDDDNNENKNNIDNENNNNMANTTSNCHDFKSGSDSWISSISMNSKVLADATDIKSTEFLFSDTDNYLGFDGPISLEDRFQQRSTSGTDGVVPVQTTKNQSLSAQLPGHHHHSSEKYFEIDFTKSNISSISYPKSYAAYAFSQSISTSSLDVGLVPDGSSMSEISYPIGKNLCSSAGDSSGSSSGANNQGSQLGGMDREARVLRYRERRKNRKFEKTIRYASRKAYAETRPRIKGRFAKRTEAVGSDIDQMFSPGSTVFFPESRYGVVPSF